MGVWQTQDGYLAGLAHTVIFPRDEVAHGLVAVLQCTLNVCAISTPLGTHVLTPPLDVCQTSLYKHTIHQYVGEQPHQSLLYTLLWRRQAAAQSTAASTLDAKVAYVACNRAAVLRL